ncbi:hypothetical protein LXL04_022095 [Taraxacum kok-saghyz]
MCKIGNSFSEHTPNKLQTLVEIDIDSCDNLITFPAMLCKLAGLRKLSVTNCLELSSLSEEFGKSLTNLEVLRLASCSKLATLPESIGNMQKLKVIDLTDCLNLQELLADIGELGCLRMIHMRGCTGLSVLPLSVKELSPLEVVCNEEISFLWKGMTNVVVQLVEEDKLATFWTITKAYSRELSLDMQIKIYRGFNYSISFGSQTCNRIQLQHNSITTVFNYSRIQLHSSALQPTKQDLTLLELYRISITISKADTIASLKIQTTIWCDLPSLLDFS